MQGKVIPFPSPQRQESPNYAGRLLCLNLEVARRFQCGGFSIRGDQNVIVEPDAQMESIHAAVEKGILIDVTDNQERKLSSNATVSAVAEIDVGKKGYQAPKKVFVAAGVQFEGIEDIEDDLGCFYMTNDLEEQKRIEAAIHEFKHRVILPPGMDNPEKYLIGSAS